METNNKITTKSASPQRVIVTGLKNTVTLGTVMIVVTACLAG